MYIINELQTASDGTVAFVPPVTKEDIFQAESDFYIKVGYAAISNVWKHTVTLDTEDGIRIRAKSYKHDANGTEVIVDDDPAPEEEA